MYKFSSDAQLNALCENLAARLGRSRLVPENLSLFDLQPGLTVTKPSVGGNGQIDGVDFDSLIYTRVFPVVKHRHTAQVITTYFKTLLGPKGRRGEVTQPFSAVSKIPQAKFLDWFLPNGKDSLPYAPFQAMMIFVRVAAMTWGEGFDSIIKDKRDFYLKIPIWGELGIKDGKLVGLLSEVETPELNLPLSVLMFETVDEPVLVQPDFYTALSVYIGENPELFPNWLTEQKLLTYLRFTAPAIKNELFWKRVKAFRDVEINKRLCNFTIKEVQNIKQLAIDRVQLAHSRGGPYLRSELCDMMDSAVMTRGNFARVFGKPDRKGRDSPNATEAERLIEKITTVCDERIAQLRSELNKLENNN